MHSYLIEYEGKTIGCYSNFDTAESFILSCLQNNFMKDSAQIHVLRPNSCLKLKSQTINLKDNFYNKKKLGKNHKGDNFNIENTYSNLSSSSSSYESSSEISSSSNSNQSVSIPYVKPITEIKQINIDYSNPAVLEMAKQKIDLQHKINILKRQKEKIEESKNVYENDLTLFNMFRKSKELDNNFEIPELFSKKYDIMEKLHVSNSLSWENFIKTFQHENFYGDYFSSNSYEDMFFNVKSDSDSKTEDTINEEFNINTDSN